MYCVCCGDLDPIQGQGQGHGAFELPTTSDAVHAGGDDRSPLAGLSGLFTPLLFGNSPYRSDASTDFLAGWLKRRGLDFLGHRLGDDLVDWNSGVSVRPSVRPQKVFPISI